MTRSLPCASDRNGHRPLKTLGPIFPTLRIVDIRLDGTSRAVLGFGAAVDLEPIATRLSSSFGPSVLIESGGGNDALFSSTIEVAGEFIVVDLIPSADVDQFPALSDVVTFIDELTMRA